MSWPTREELQKEVDRAYVAYYRAQEVMHYYSALEEAFVKAKRLNRSVFVINKKFLFSDPMTVTQRMINRDVQTTESHN